VNRIEFFVPGVARPQGSKRAFMPKRGKRPIMVEQTDEKTRNWRSDLKQIAKDARDRALAAGLDLRGKAVEVTIVFAFPRATSHLLASGALRKGRPLYHQSRPDADKLMRAFGDAVTHIVIGDDSELAHVHLFKTYTRGVPGAFVSLRCAPRRLPDEALALLGRFGHDQGEVAAVGHADLLERPLADTEAQDHGSDRKAG
jgi:Holliday junction resolvase RusA-like endonuclease